MASENREAITENAVRDIKADGSSALQVGNNYSHTINNYNGSNSTNANQCMADLGLTDPRVEKTRIEITKGGLLRESSNWILDHVVFKRWREDRDHRLLWIKGDAGIGKTMLLCGILDELRRDKAEEPNQAKPGRFNRLVEKITGRPKHPSLLASSSTVSFFLCQGTDSRLNSATAVLRGLMYVLLDQQPCLLSHIQKKYDRRGRQLFEDPDAFYTLSEALIEMLRDCRDKDCFIIIDALDECKQDLSNLLNFIDRATSNLDHVKWIVSSRHLHDIDQKLSRAVSRSGQTLDLNSSLVSQAINIYIDDKVTNIVSSRHDETLKSRVQTELRNRANGTFLWVALAIKQLENVENRHMMNILDQIPTGLTPLYEQMMAKIHDLADEKRKLCYAILSTATVAYRPLHLLELGMLSGFPEDISSDIQATETMVGNCGHFISIRDNVVYFIHQSVKDFFTNQESNNLLDDGLAPAHSRLFRNSMLILNKTLRRDIYDLTNPGILIDQIQVPKSNPLAPIAYSCAYWVDHMHDTMLSGIPTSSGDSHQYGLVDSFLRTNYLYWLEALSLLHMTSEAVLILYKLEALVKISGPSGLVEFLIDARRFLLANKVAIETAPLQLYSSVLQFSPERSIIRNIYQHEVPKWYILNSSKDLDWDQCIQTLEGHTNFISSVATSADGLKIVSGSADGTMKIWNLATGQCIRTINGSGPSFQSVALPADPDDKRIFSYNRENSIEIWDSLTGQRLKKFDGPNQSDRSVWDTTRIGSCFRMKRYSCIESGSIAFSTDCQKTAFGLKSGIIQVYDTAKGECTHSLKSHTGRINSVGFSSDGQHLVSGSDDNTIKIWDIAIGQCLQSLEGHQDAVRSVAFSPDGQHVISSSFDVTLKMWDIATHQSLTLLEHFRGRVHLVAFSPDGQHVILGSENEIEVWNTATGQCMQSLKGHVGRVTSLGFSLDGRRLISGSWDHTIKIWDTATSRQIQSPEDYTSTARSIAVSPDIQSSILDCDNTPLEILGIPISQPQIMSESESGFGQVSCIALSKDGKHIASGFMNGSIRIWNVDTPRDMMTLEGHRTSIESVSFSTDSTRLVSCSWDGIKYWVIVTSQCTKTLIGSSTFAVLSTNGQRIATTYFGGRVKIWDVASEHQIWHLKPNKDVESMAFSQDDKRLFCCDYRGIDVWDIKTRKLIQSFHLDYWGDLIIYEVVGSKLMTNLGLINLEFKPENRKKSTRISSCHVQPHKCGIDWRGRWIIKDGIKIVWLPSYFENSQFLVAGTTLGILSRTGSMVIIKFPPNELNR